MSRIKKRATPKVTAPVTAKPEKEPVVKTTMTEIMEAMDFAQTVGERAGVAQGLQQGRVEGLKAPRTAAEAHARELRTPISNVLQEVFIELQKAYTKFGKQQASPHEGYAVLREEVDELWDEIKADRGRQASARKEAIQAAAMAVRYVLDNDPR